MGSTPISLPVLLLCLAATFLLSLVFALVVALVFVLHSGVGPGPNPNSDYDAAFESVGQQYAASLPEACGAAWVAGARDLDRGSTVSASLLHVAKLWDETRKASFNELVAPKLAEIVPEASNEKEISPAQRRALAAAWRGFAAGLNGGSLPQAPVTPIEPTPTPTPKPHFAPEPKVVEPVEVTPKPKALNEVKDVWRVRPSDQRIEDFGHYDAAGKFVFRVTRWRDGFGPSSN
jgi:hypothetical protein